MVFFSIAFMFSTIYLRLEGSVTPPYPGLSCWMLYRWRLRLQRPAWWKMIFSIAFMFSTIYLRLEGNVPPLSGLNIFFHECFRFLIILVMGDLPLPPHTLPTFISSLSKTVKRKPLIFNFKWNFGWILGQHNILVLGENFFFIQS